MKIYQYDLDYRKDSSIKVVKFYSYNNKQELLYLNIYCSLLNRKIDGFTRKELLQKKYQLYDMKLSVNVSEFENYYKIIYSVNFIRDKYLQESIKAQVIDIFLKFINSEQFDSKELELIKSDYHVYLQKLYENHNLMCEDNLLKNIDEKYLSITDMENYLNNITITDIDKIRQRVKILPGFVNAINAEGFEDYDFNLIDQKLDIVDINYNNVGTLNENQSLNQCYINLALSIKSSSVDDKQIANIVLGADVFSFLFKIIREKKHLSYNIYSKIFSRNLILIQGGVSIEHKDEIEKEIIKVLDLIRSEGFVNEFELAKKALQENIIAKQNDIGFLTGLSQRNYLNNTDLTVDDYLEIINKIKYEDVKEIFETCEFIGTSLRY